MGIYLSRKYIPMGISPPKKPKRLQMYYMSFAESSQFHLKHDSEQRSKDRMFVCSMLHLHPLPVPITTARTNEVSMITCFGGHLVHEHRIELMEFAQAFLCTFQSLPLFTTLLYQQSSSLPRLFLLTIIIYHQITTFPSYH